MIASAVAVAAGPAGTGVARAAACTPHGTLTYGIAGAGISALDPNTISFAGQEPLQTLLYDALTRYAQDGSIQPDLATKWRSSKDLKTWWFWLRRDVEYANGRAFTSADAVANILRVLSPDVASQQRGQIQDFRSVRAISKYEVRIRLGHPSALVPVALTDIKMSDTTDIANLDKVGNGTGPYKVGTYVPGQSLTVVPNPHWFGGAACIAKIVFVREPDPTAMVTDFTGGKLSVIWQIPPASLQTVEADRNATLIKPRSISGAHVWELDTTSPPFSNPLARQALEYAIDRNAMVKAAFFGQALPSPADDLLSTASPAYDKTLKPYTFDLQKAKQLFAQAGVKPGTTFTFWALAGRRDEWVTMGEILQQDLQKIGLNLSIQRNDVSTWLGKFYPAGKSYPGTIVANYFSMPPNPTFAFQQGQYGNCECNWNNPKLEALAKQAAATADQTKRRAIYAQMQEIYSQGAPVAVIAHQTNIVAAQKSVLGAWEDPAGNVHLESARLAR
ncbi:MAG TPA: ABC transporter substrate-binding protein [Gaiellaceae bacterium]|nr:ABC transporter substrate-binding protein [Gaiellaceae bacterium]